KYIIQPGAETLFADMLGRGQTLPGGCAFGDGEIERTSVLVTYTCPGGSVVLQLLHPELAPPGGVRTKRFAVTVNSGRPPDGFVDAVAERIRAHEAGFEWATPAGAGTQTRRWELPIVAGTAVAILVFWGLRRLLAGRRHQE